LAAKEKMLVMYLSHFDTIYKNSSSKTTATITFIWCFRIRKEETQLSAGIVDRDSGLHSGSDF